MTRTLLISSDGSTNGAKLSARHCARCLDIHGSRAPSARALRVVTTSALSGREQQFRGWCSRMKQPSIKERPVALAVSTLSFVGMVWAFYPKEGTVGRGLFGLMCLLVTAAAPFILK
jgi:hypothetical protein